MKIAINLLSAKIGGGVSFARNLTLQLLAQDQVNEYIFFVSDDGANDIINSVVKQPNLRVIRWKTPNLLMRMFKEQFILPLLVWEMRVDILFCPANILSFFACCRTVLWIQNIDPFVDFKGENWLRRIKILFLRIFTKISICLADIVIFSSNYSQQLALNQMRIQKDKTRRISLGADLGSFKWLQTREKQDDDNYLLSVSNISKRKNYEVLIKAYTFLPDKIRNNFRLVLVGRIENKYRTELLSLCADKKTRERIVFTGELKGDELSRIYEKASFFVLPSLVESFSLPIIEAMASGLPIIAANATCLPEMLGDCGLLFDPRDYRDLVEKIKMLIEDSELQRRLMEKGVSKAKLFSWNRTAQETLRVFQELESRKR